MGNAENAVALFDKLAAVYQDKFMDTGLYHDSFNRFCDAIAKPDARILELACGPGNITRYLLNRRPDFKILGTDLAPNMLQLARINNPEAKFELMDCRDINNLNTKYEGIMCGFCLPYLSKAEAVQLIKNASQILTRNGALYLSTMEGDHSTSGYEASSSGEKMYINYHEAAYLAEALTGNGFKIIAQQRIQYPGKDGKTITDLVIIAVLGL